MSCNTSCKLLKSIVPQLATGVTRVPYPSWRFPGKIVNNKHELVNRIMQIFIKSGAEDGKIPEWGLLEFQGSFVSRDEGCSIFDEYIGDLNFTNDGIPFFIIGHHILYGQEVKLQRPMAVMHKNFTKDSLEKEYLVKAVIRRKIIFKSRPKPIITQEALKGNK